MGKTNLKLTQMCALGISYLLMFAACSTPQTKKEFKEYSKKKFEKVEFTVNLSYSDTKARLRDFGKRCLETKLSHYTINENKKGLTLYAQRIAEKPAGESPPAEDGAPKENYFYMTELFRSHVNQTKGTAYASESFRGVDTKQISTHMVNWLRNEREFCPDLGL